MAKIGYHGGAENEKLSKAISCINAIVIWRKTEAITAAA
jgi:hypothetical protein